MSSDDSLIYCARFDLSSKNFFRDQAARATYIFYRLVIPGN